MKRKYILDNLKSRNSIQFYNKDDYMVLYGGKIIGVINKELREQYDGNKLYYIARIKDFDSCNRYNYVDRFITLYAAKLAIIDAFEKMLENNPTLLYAKESNIDIKSLPCGDNTEFYPTPNSLVGKMLKGIDWNMVHTVLEPSAGKGDIVSGILKASRKHYRELDIDCIERDIFLQHILRGEGYRVVHDDFLTFNSRKHYDLIIMNPPFSNADEHLLKAIELQRNGGAIICLLNAQTLKNPCTKRRQILIQKLFEKNAQICYLKHEFKKAERQTDVEIAMVKVCIPHTIGVSDIFENLKKSRNVSEDIIPEREDIAPSDLAELFERQFNLEVDASLKLIQEYNALRPYMMNSLDKNDHYKHAILTLTVGTDSNHLQKLDVNDYLRKVRMKYWNALFSRKEFTGKLTSNLQDKYRNMVDELADYDFTKYNIERIHTKMNAEMVQAIKQSILSLFDTFSEEHSYYPECTKNIHYYNGWKTNKAHKVGMKVILPANGMFASYSFRGPLETYTVYNKLSDIEKVFNYLSGHMNADSDLERIICAANDNGQTKNIECKYFTVTLYKKGTAHITFKDEDLIEAFNIFAAQNKNWLPPSYGKKNYSDMSSEEKTVIDDFQGEDKYTKVMLNKDKFLYAASEQLLLC